MRQPKVGALLGHGLRATKVPLKNGQAPPARSQPYVAGGQRIGSVSVQSLELPERSSNLTHYLFRFPAKFHPPVVRALIERFTEPGNLILDPFCGSGTMMVEAARLGRHSLGIDIDPLAVRVSNAKIARYKIGLLKRSLDAVSDRLSTQARPPAKYVALKFSDLSAAQYAKEIADVSHYVPAIPNLLHWFRRYVIVDLARIREAILTTPLPDSHRRFLLVVFASIIRTASNADPVPVSGLEVTSWMKQRDLEGRLVDPYKLFGKASSAALSATESFARAAPRSVRAVALQGNATQLASYCRGQVDAVLTSPPYHGAVDYYRRHQLEMFWLGLTRSQEERLALLADYIGRPHVPRRHPWLSDELSTKLAIDWESRIRRVSADRANAFRHYLVAMSRFFRTLSGRVRVGGPVLVVVGHSAWNTSEIPTTDLFMEIAGPSFKLEEVLSYPVKNHYMSYARHNDAGITREYVLVMRKTNTSASGENNRR